MDPEVLLEAVTSLIIAAAALAALGGTGVYMVRRRSNGQPVIPRSDHDEMVGALNAIETEISALHVTVKESNGNNRTAHEEILDAVAPRIPRG